MTNPANTLRALPNFDAAKVVAKPVVRAHAGERFTVVYRGVWAQFTAVRFPGGKLDRVLVDGAHVESQHANMGALDFVCALGYFQRHCDRAALIERGCKAKGKVVAGSHGSTSWEGVTGSHMVVRSGETRNTFTVGARAALGGWNVTYYGTICAITAKTVSVIGTSDTSAKRFTHVQFATLNDHDFARRAEQDAETRMSM